MIVINSVGLILIGLIVWWFWIAKNKTTLIKHASIDIVLENGIYEPPNILIDANKEYELLVTRKDETPCAEFLMIPSLNISETLKLNESVTIKLPKLKPGDYPFHCQMKMYKGLISVK